MGFAPAGEIYNLNNYYRQKFTAVKKKVSKNEKK